MTSTNPNLPAPAQAVHEAMRRSGTPGMARVANPRDAAAFAKAANDALGERYDQEADETETESDRDADMQWETGYRFAMRHAAKIARGEVE